jgi:hypothetical protein
MSGILQGLIASLGGKITELTEVFNATVYEGTGASRTVTTNIDTLNEGGLIWIKNLERSNSGHALFNTANTGGSFLTPSGHDDSRILSTAGLTTGAGSSNVGFTAAGFTLSTDTAQAINNFYTDDYLALTMRKAPKFFDVVTYTGTGSTQTIAHNLGSTPGMIIVKRTDGTASWQVYHRGLGVTKGIRLDATAAETTSLAFWNDTEPTSSVFTVGTDASTNSSTQTYVAFVFAHEAGGFGASSVANAVSCGSFTGTGSTLTVDCGFDASARFVMIKRTDSTGGWFMWDSVRGIVAGNDPYVVANTQAAQAIATDAIINTFSTGFELPAGSALNISAASYIYLAIA